MKDESDMKTFNRICGEILRFAIDVENRLELFIRDYFLEHFDYRSGMFNDYILTEIGFGRKIDIFKEICEQEGVNLIDIGNVVKPIKELKKLRDKVSHFEVIVTKEEGIILCPRKDVYKAKDDVKITEKTIKKIEGEWTIKIVHGIEKIRTRIVIENHGKQKKVKL